MDAVELQLPANVVVSKLLGGGVREGSGIEHGRIRVPHVADLPVFRGVPFGTSATSFQGDIQPASDYVESKLVCGVEKTSTVMDAQDCREHLLYAERSNYSSTLPKCWSKKLNRKAGKVPVEGNHAIKRAKTIQAEGFLNSSGFCAKSRRIKLKHGRDHKSGSRRISRSTLRVQSDHQTSRLCQSGVTSPRGSNILGIYGLKSEYQNVEHHMRELSMHDLLSGSYKSTAAAQEKGKDCTTGNTNIVASVRKACSVLPVPSAPNSGYAEEDLCAHSRREVKSFAADLPIYDTKEIMERLTPHSWCLEALLSRATLNFQKNFDECSAFTASENGHIPAFPWSLSPNGFYKPISDSGKISGRNSVQNKWVKVDSIPLSNYAVELDLDTKGFPTKLLSGMPIVDSQCKSENVHLTSAYLSNSRIFKTSVPSSLGCELPECSGPTNTSSVICPSVETLPFRTSNHKFEISKALSTEVHLSFKKSINDSMREAADDVDVQRKDGLAEIENIRLRQVCNINDQRWQSEPSVSGRDIHLKQEETSLFGTILASHSPRLLAAAQTLYDLSNGPTKALSVNTRSSESMPWLRKPSLKPPKVSKMKAACFDRKEDCSSSVRLIKNVSVTKLGGKMSSSPVTKTFETANGSGTACSISSASQQESVRWSIPVTNKSPFKPEKTLVNHSQPAVPDPVKLVTLIPPPVNGSHKSFCGQQKFRKPATGSPAGMQCKDQSRGKTTR